MQTPTDHRDAQPSASLPPGTRLNGIFEIDEHLSSGGMGEIYRGHAIENGELVAIKVMRGDLADDETALALFRKEAKALHTLHHEAIVRYFVFSSDPGIRRHYLAMEFVRGERLSHIVQRRRLDFHEVRQLQQRLAAALHEAHRNGIIHRDVSPDNILVTDGDVARAKIIDFGIARSIRSDDTTIIGGGFAGKYNYVSPEQVGLFGCEVTAQSDIYSLGLVLAECLLGLPIDMRGTEVDVVEKRRVVPDLHAVDARFRPLLIQMLQPDPKDRPSSMAAVAAWQPGEKAPPATASETHSDGKNGAPISRVSQNTPPKRNSASRGALAATVLALLVLGGGGAIFYFTPGFLPWRIPPSAPHPPPVDPIEGIRHFIEAYDGGDCFWIYPETIGERDTRVYGLGNLQEPFDMLDRAFRREFGFEATIEINLIAPPQCPTLTFASHARRRSRATPHHEVGLDIDEEKLKADGVLMGSITGVGTDEAHLLRVVDSGAVHNLTSMLTSNGVTKSFEVRLPPRQDGATRPQLLIAVISDGPLNALKFSAPGAADTVFAHAYTEAIEARRQLTVGVKYFNLSGISPNHSVR